MDAESNPQLAKEGVKNVRSASGGGGTKGRPIVGDRKMTNNYCKFPTDAV